MKDNSIMRLTESQFYELISESVKVLLKEYYNDSNKSIEEIMPNLVITNLDSDDNIISIMYYREEEFEGIFGDISEMQEELNAHNIRYDKSIKVIDKTDGNIYGFLLMSECDIDEGTYGAVRKYIGDDKIEQLEHLRGCEGYLFMLDKRLRGTSIYKKMLSYMFNNAMNGYDYIYCAVAHQLRSHSLYLRLGFQLCGEDDDAKYYILPLSQEAKRIVMGK